MCFSASYWAGVTKIVYACRKTPEMISKFYYEGKTDIKRVNEGNNRKIEIVLIPDFEEEVKLIIKEWEDKQKLNSQV